MITARIKLLIFLTGFLLTCVCKVYAQQSFSFIENKNQWHSNVLYKTQLDAGALYFENNRVTYLFYDKSDIAHDHSGGHHDHDEKQAGNVNYHYYRVSFINSNNSAKIIPDSINSDYSNYFIGNDKSKWASYVRNYKVLTYKSLYNNIDLKYYSYNDILKYDYIIQVGGNPDDIKMDYFGVDDIKISKGNIKITTSVNEVLELRPYAYQLIDNKKVEIECNYSLNGNVVTYSFPKGYDKSKPLIIDPELIFSTYSGSPVNNFGMTATYDDEGNLYAGGMAFGDNYPTTEGAFDTSFSGIVGEGITDVVITKYNSIGTSRIYSTYIGGDQTETVHSLIVNSDNELFLYGVTGSSNFPTTTNAYDTSFAQGDSIFFVYNGTKFINGTDIYVAKINSDGSDLLGSTYIGGDDNDGINYNCDIIYNYDTLMHNYGDQFRGEIMVDDVGDCYVVSSTKSDNFPIVNGFDNSLGGCQDGVVMKFNNDLSALHWSTFIGGDDKDASYGVKVSKDGSVYITGGTTSNNFQTTSGVYNEGFNGGVSDAYISKISSDGTQLLASTFIGTSSYDQSYFIELDADENVYIVGQSLGGFPVTPGLYSNPNSSQFITKLNNNLTDIIFSTVFGNGDNSKINISPSAFLVDHCENIYVSGWGASVLQLEPLSGMPLSPDAYQSTTDGFDFYLMVLERDAQSLLYATYFGGDLSKEHVDGGTSRFDKKGIIYQSVCAGCQDNDDFPTTPGVVSNTNESTGCNNGVFKFDFQIMPNAEFSTSDVSGCAPFTVVFTDESINNSIFTWDFGNGNTSTELNPVYTFQDPGTYTVSLIVEDEFCDFKDTAVKQITVYPEIQASIEEPSPVCLGDSVLLTLNSPEIFTQYLWSTNESFTDTLNSNLLDSSIYVTPSQNSTYYVMVENANCEKVLNVYVTVSSVQTISEDKYVCVGDTAILNVVNQQPSDILTYSWQPISLIISGENTATPEVYSDVDTLFYYTAVNQFGCLKQDSIKYIIDDLELVVSHQNISCYNVCDGTAISVANGIPDYTYQWSNGASGNSVSGLCENDYYVTVTDGIGCVDTASFTIVEPPQLISNIVNVVNAICDGVCSGEIEIDASGGTSPFYYNWSNDEETNLITDLCVGWYIVTISDENGCEILDSAFIDDPSDLTLSVIEINNASCFDYCDGSALLDVSLGNPPYSYLWSNDSVTSEISNLCVGEYMVTVIDEDNCVRVGEIEITQPDLLITNLIQQSPILCNGYTSSLNSLTIGGTEAYTYQWSHNQSLSSNIAEELIAGEYSITVTDANGCKDSSSVIITEPDTIGFDTILTNVYCIEACNGSIQVSASGGTNPYFYSWDIGENSSQINDLCIGDYTVTITDNNGCELIESFYVDTSDYELQIDVWADEYYLYQGETTTLHVSGNYNYLWSPVEELRYPSSSTPTAKPHQTTLYSVIAYDSYGCKTTDTVTVFVIDVICDEPYIYVPNAFTPNGDNLNDILYVESNMIQSMYFAIYDRWGELMFETDDKDIGWNGTYKGKEVDPAVFVYYLKVTCIGNAEFVKKGNITLMR